MSYDDNARETNSSVPGQKRVLGRPVSAAEERERSLSERRRLRLAQYQRAYELARRQAVERKKAFIPPFQFDEDYEAGGGI